MHRICRFLAIVYALSTALTSSGQAAGKTAPTLWPRSPETPEAVAPDLFLVLRHDFSTGATTVAGIGPADPSLSAAASGCQTFGGPVAVFERLDGTHFIQPIGLASDATGLASVLMPYSETWRFSSVTFVGLPHGESETATGTLTVSASVIHTELSQAESRDGRNENKAPHTKARTEECFITGQTCWQVAGRDGETLTYCREEYVCFWCVGIFCGSPHSKHGPPQLQPAN